MKKFTVKEMKAIYDAANEAGMKAGNECNPDPMGVVDQRNKRLYVVNDGPCGFAWVNIKPGNSRFANWLKKNKLARKDSYYGGVTVWVSHFNQSMTRKNAYAGAFARVVREKTGMDRVYPMSRMD